MKLGKGAEIALCMLSVLFLLKTCSGSFNVEPVCALILLCTLLEGTKE